MIQGVLFDMDGILFDTEKMAARLEGDILQEMGYARPNSALYIEICGAGSRQIQNIFLREYGENFDYAAFMAHVRQAIAEELAEHGVPKMPGLDACLSALTAAGYKLAVASSSQYKTVSHYLENAGIAHYFSAVIAGDMVPKFKPEPDIFIAAAKALGLTPQSCLAVEDSVNGVTSAAAAGCVTVMIPDMLPATPALRQKAAAVLNSLADIVPFLQSQAAQG
ncbi:MAG: HAD family hydrolase [Oscillospiraceae bacterium]